MRVKKFLVSFAVVTIVFFLGYKRDSFADFISGYNLDYSSLWSRIETWFKATAPSLPTTKESTAKPTTDPLAAKDTASGKRSARPGLESLHGNVTDQQMSKQAEYFEKLRQRNLELQGEEPPEPEESGAMDNSVEVVEDEEQVTNDNDAEPLPEALADPYAQFRRPADSATEEPSDFVSENLDEEIVEDNPDGEESLEFPPEEEEEIFPDEQGLDTP